MLERTFFIIKPDGVQRGLIGEILNRIERKGLKIEKLEMRKLERHKLKAHYKDLVEKDFYVDLENYMTDDPVVIGVLIGDNAISVWRKMMGATNPSEAELGTIRGDLGLVEKGIIKNLVHGSDSKSSALNEINIWF